MDILGLFSSLLKTMLYNIKEQPKWFLDKMKEMNKILLNYKLKRALKSIRILFGNMTSIVSTPDSMSESSHLSLIIEYYSNLKISRKHYDNNYILKQNWGISNKTCKEFSSSIFLIFLLRMKILYFQYFSCKCY